MQLNKYLHKKRKENGYSMRDLVKRAEIGLGTYCDLENGNADPRLSTLTAIANAYNMELWRMLKQADK